MTAILPSRLVEKEESREWSDFNFHSPTQQYTPCRPALPRSGPKPPLRASPEPTRLPVIEDPAAYPIKVRVLPNKPTNSTDGEEWQDGVFEKKKRADIVVAANQQTPSAMPKILSVKGETVYLKNSTDQYLHASGVILDTGNDACTLISEKVAKEWKLEAAPGKGDLCVKDIYGDLHHEKRVWLSLKIRNHEFWVLGAVSGSVPILVGMDVIGQLFKLGYAIGAL